MSVVIKMDMPKNCEECRFCFVCGRMFVTSGAVDYYCCKLKEEDKNEPHKYEFSQNELEHRQEFCPLKSVDGLIDELEKKYQKTTVKDDYLYGKKHAFEVAIEIVRKAVSS